MADNQPLVVNTPIPQPFVTSHPIAPSGTPQVIVVNTQGQGNVSTASGNQGFKVRAGRITGGIQIVCGVLSLIFGIVSLLSATCVIGQHCFYGDFASFIAWPIWGSIFFYLVAGIIGVSTGNKNTCVIVAYMVMSILGALSAAGQVIMESIGAVIVTAYHCENIRTTNYYPYEYEWTCYNVGLPVAMHSLSAIVAFVEMIVAIVSAAYCCHGVCCRTAPQQVIVQYTTPAAVPLTVQPPSAPPQYHEYHYLRY